ncbi:ribonuclease PH [candidate division CSSED10-310 bacterium]|uniref:Ribonuclease PH n=1 Tax=candidate division CSSED10-310 bacterium TaxID=2855610 RepID=A0ABV6YZD0_UNCC1
MRVDGRKFDELRPIKVIRNFQKFAAGSVLIEFGETKVICSATIEDKVPAFLKNSKSGWVTSEYSLLPGSTSDRTARDSTQGKISGRSQEIQRMIGRALRAVVDLKALGEKTIWLDCDVIQADGGTRTAAVTGAWLALFDALLTLDRKNKKFPITDFLAAVSVGIVNEHVLLDLDYSEDSHASVDLNLVLTGQARIVEIQGTAELEPFDFSILQEILNMAQKGIFQLVRIQQDFAGEFFHNLLTVKGFNDSVPE